jgi:hypothetical protein
MAVFLSELRSDQGSSSARLPVAERSGFIDEMVRVWAPDNWKAEYKDIREEAKSNSKEERRDAGAK